MKNKHIQMYEQCHCHLVKGFSYAMCIKEANIKKTRKFTCLINKYSCGIY